jgi:hypothetical protein
MRKAVLPLAGGDEHLPRAVREFHQKYKEVSGILDEHPEIVEAADGNLKKLSHGGSKGRKGGRLHRKSVTEEHLL